MPTLFARCLVSTAVAALASLCVLPGHARAQCQYDVTVLQFPIDCGIGTVITAGLSLNDDGAVVGRYKCPISKYSQGFLWTAEGGFVALDPPPGVIQVFPTGINDQGVICGTMIVDDIGFRGFVYDDGLWTQLPPVVDVPAAWSSAAAISNDGVVVGQRSIREDTSPQIAFMWSAAEGFSELAGIDTDHSSAAAITGGRVVGWAADAGNYAEAFLWEDGNPTFLGPIPGGFESRAIAVTNDAIVVGSGAIPMKGFPFGVSRAFLWENRKFTMLGTLPGHMHSGAGDVSDARIVVGKSSNVDGNPNISHGFVWQDGTMHNLNDLIPPELELLIQSATAIGNAGRIVANGHDANGDVVAFLLTPIEPVGDLDADCEVGILDLLILLAAWGEAGSPADLNNDGVVGILDLLTLLANWT